MRTHFLITHEFLNLSVIFASLFEKARGLLANFFTLNLQELINYFFLTIVRAILTFFLTFLIINSIHLN